MIVANFLFDLSLISSCNNLNYSKSKYISFNVIIYQSLLENICFGK